MSGARETTHSWRELLDPAARQRLAARLLAFARQRRWFRAKTREVRGAEVADVIPLDGASLDDAANVMAVLHISYAQGEADLYVIPLAWSDAPGLARESPHAVIGGEGAPDGLVDGLATGSAAAALFELARTGATRRGERGEVRGDGSPLFTELAGDGTLRPRVPRAEQTNSTVLFGDRAVLKIYRQLTAGPSPELEVGRFLTDACDPPCVPRVLGALSYQPKDGGPAYVIGISHEQIANQGEAWSLALREVKAFFGRVRGEPPPVSPTGGAAWLAAARAAPERASTEAIGSFLSLAATLGRRTGQLHLALAGGSSPPTEPDFAPEPLSLEDRRALVARATGMLRDAVAALNAATRSGVNTPLTPAARPLAEQLLAPESEQKISRLLAAFRDAPFQAMKTRTHGDLHLGQILALAHPGGGATTDAVDDFMIIDFEGEPARPLAERRAKSSPLRDVMGMVRSFAYVPEASLREGAAGTTPRADGGALARWAALWTREVTAEYLRAYLRTVDGASFVPRDDAQLALLLTYYELERVIYEVGYELDNRPDWTEIPLRGLLAAAGLEGGRS
jgi:trehalose synthase-fused probable maltokinase